MLNSPVNGKIQGLFKAFECFSSTFQGKFNFQGLFKTVRDLYIQVLFKPVRTLIAQDWKIYIEYVKAYRQKTYSIFALINYPKCFDTKLDFFMFFTLIFGHNFFLF